MIDLSRYRWGETPGQGLAISLGKDMRKNLLAYARIIERSVISQQMGSDCG